VKKCQAAGITPVAVGGKDKWPLHFYPTFLMMRILGKEGMQAAYDDKNGGFTNPEIVLPPPTMCKRVVLTCFRTRSTNTGHSATVTKALV
jgi:raffinose/stachyose/melibiose transport system substrate-binding protein